MTKFASLAGRGINDVRRSRELTLRKALFASTALVGVTLGVPTAAQTINPAGGGTVRTTSGTITGGGANEGVLVQQTGAGSVDVTGVTITNGGTTPTVDGLRVVGPGGRGVGIGILTTSTITSQTGDGVRLQGGGGENVGFGVTAGQTLNVTGVNGLNITSTQGLFLPDLGTAGAIVATARTPNSGAGVRIATAGGFGGSLGNVTATNFATGIDLSGNGVGATIEGGSITGANDGIRADSTANIILDSRASIQGTNGIYTTAANGVVVTTSGAGTINARFNAIGAGITAISTGGTGAVTVNSGEVIGNNLAYYYGIDAQTTNTSTGTITVNNTASIYATDRGISAVSAGGAIAVNNSGAILTGNNGIFTANGNGTTIATTGGGTIDSEVAGTGTGINVTGTGLTQVTQGAAIGGTTALNRGIVATATGAGTVNVASNAAITTSANSARGILVTTAGGIATVATSAAISTPGNGVTVNTGTGVATTTIGGAINISGTSGTGVEAFQVGAASILNVNANVIGGNRALSAKGTVNVAAGVAVTTDVFAVDLSSTGTLNNSGALTANYRTVAFSGTLNNLAGGTITSTGSYATAQNRAAVYSQSSGTIVNSGTITGTGPAYGVLVESGVLNLTNASGGNITSTAGAIFLNSTSAATLNLQSGSTVTGDILSQNSGTRTVTLAGTLTGNYNAGSGTGVNTFTLASTGSMQGATFGSAADTFNWQGGTIGGTINGGAGNNNFNVQLGAGNSASLAMSATSNFSVRDLQSGTLTLTGSSPTGVLWYAQNGTVLNIAATGFNPAGGGSYGVYSYGGTVNVLAGATVSGNNNFAATFTAANPVIFSNAGTITVDGNVFLSNGSRMDVTNTGTMTSASYGGVRFEGGFGSVTNSGTITGGSFTTGDLGAAVYTVNAITINNNAGGILQTSTGGPYAVRLGTGSTVNNAAGAIIRQVATNRAAAINATGATTINNSGMISTAATGAFDAVTILGRLTLTNSGTITATAASGVAFTGTGSALTNTGGTITGGSDVNFGYGVQAAAGSTGTLTNQSGGLITGGRGGVLEAGTSLTVNNSAIIRGTDATSYGIMQTTGTLAVSNIGAASRIVGQTNGVNSGSGTLALSNAGTIGTGTVDGAGVFTVGGVGFAVQALSANITNTGVLTSTGASIYQNSTTGTLNLVNTGTIGGAARATDPDDTIVALGTATILNSGTITTPNFYAIGLGNGGTVTNAAGGQITAGAAGDRYGIQTANGAVTINNYGSIGSTGNATANGAATNDAISRGIYTVNNAATINLFAGSTTGAILTGVGNDTLAIYNGRGTSGAATTTSYTDAVSGATSTMTLQNASTLAAASFGTIDLGGGTDTLMLRGTGDGSAGNGAAGTFSIATSTGAEILTKADIGTWTLTGAAITPGITINAGTGGVPGSGGLLIFNGTTGLTGPIYVNGGTIRANQTGAFGSGTIHAVDPTIQFAASGTNANNYVLDVAAPASADPTTFESIGANAIVLNGSITTGTGNNINGAAIAPNQFVTFAGTNGSSFTLGNAANSWTGTTTVNSGITLTGSSQTISGGTIVDNGALNYNQTVDGTAAQAISGTGTLTKTGAASLTLSGANTYTGTTTVSAGQLIAAGGAAISDSGAVVVDSGATFGLAASETTGSIAGAGTFNVGANRLITGGNNATTTVSGSITDAAPIAYVGSWNLQDGPRWTTTPPTYTGQEAAALLFGGSAANYRISTAGTAVGAINRLAYYDTYAGDITTYADTYRVDNGVAGYSQLGDTSAYVNDHGGTFINYAFSGGASLGGGLTKTGTGTLTLSGANTYTGLTSIIGGTLEVRNGAAIADTGTVDVAAPGVFAVTNAETIANLTGTGATTLAADLTLAAIAGSYAGNVSGAGALNVAGGSKTLSGALTNAGGLRITDASTVTIGATGSIVTSGNPAVVGANGARLNVLAGGVVRNTAATTISGSGATLIIDNAGVIDGTSGNTIQAGGVAVTLTNSGTISTTNFVSALVGANSVVTNSGTISGGTDGTFGRAVEVNGAGTVANQGTGTIVGRGNAGIYSDPNALLTVTNTANARIVGATSGIATNGSIDLTNAGLIGSGTLSGGSSGTYTASGSRGVSVGAGGIVRNNGGTIQGSTGAGIYSNAGALTVNSTAATGVISGTIGVQSQGALTLTNAGRITGTSATLSGVAASGAAGTISNTGTIEGGTQAIVLNAGGTVNNLGAGSILRATNTANINNASGIYSNGALNLTNQGAISTASSGLSYGVQAQGNATIDNSGSISGGTGVSGGIYAAGTLNLFNAGSIVSGGNRSAVTSLGLLTIDTSGTISSQSNVNGTIVAEAGLALTNSGTISSTNREAVYVRTGNSTVTNNGTINAFTNGVWADNTTGTSSITNNNVITGNTGILTRNTATIVNNGTITGSNGIYTFGNATVSNYGTLIARGDGNGVALEGGGTATNYAGGTISAIEATTAWGMYTGFVAGTLDNRGTIDAGIGLVAAVAGTVVTNSGTINARDAGIANFGNVALNATNSGTITARTTDALATVTGVRASFGGTVTNSGTISGVATGVAGAGAATVVTNNGTISGSTAAIALTGAFADTVNLGATSVTNGLVSLGAGADTLNFTTGASVTGNIDGGAGVDSFNVTGTGTSTIAGNIVNFESFTKGGTGTLTLTGTNGAFGTVAINAGRLNVGGGNAIADTDAVTVASGATFGLNASETIGSLAGAGAVDLGANALTVAGAASTTYSGVMSGVGGSLVKTGTGTLIISGANTYTGATEIRGGVLQFGANDVLSDATALTIFNGGTLNLAGFSDTVGTFEIQDGGVLVGGGTLTANAANLNGGTVGMAINAVTVNQLSNVTTLSGAVAGNVITATNLNILGGTLALGASNQIADTTAVTINPLGTFNLGGFDETVASVASSGTINGTGTLTASTYDLSGGVVNANLGAGTLSTSGGTTTLNGTSAANVVQVNAGTLALGASERLSDTAFLSIATNGVLDLGAFAETVGNAAIAGTLNGTGTLNAASYTLNGGTVNANLGNVAAANGGAGSVLFQQTGTSTLNGTSAATQTSVNGGTLVLGAGDRLADTSTVFVNTGGTLDLQGFNETVGAIEIAGALNGTGTLTAGNYTLDGGTVNANLGAGTLAVVGFNGRASVLNGTSATTVVSIQGGNLQLGASERLADNAAVFVDRNAFDPNLLGTLDLQGFNETVGSLTARGGSTLAGTGTLTASSYQLQDAVINANLGAGTLTQQSGTGTLNGTSAAQAVNVSGGTLVLGASERLADTAAVSVNSGAVLNLGANNETVGNISISGTLNGTGTLTATLLAANGANYTLNAGTVNANLGTGILRVVQGASTLNGTSAATAVNITSGSLTLGASERLADNAALLIGTGAALNLASFNETVGTAAISGTLNGTGTLTAATYTLTGATVNGNLGAGTLTQASGTSTLNGTSAAGTVNVNGGTLTLGASNRLADNAAVAVATGAALNLGANSDTVGSLALSGALNGTGTLTAATYTLTGGTANANLGTGTLTQASGTSTLNGTSAAATVNVTGGTLTLGAAERLADTAALTIGTGGTLNLTGFNETVGSAAIGGTLAGTGTLTATSYALTGGTVNANLGAGTLTQASGTSTLNGTSAAGTVNVTGGTLTLGAAERLADTAALAIGADGVLDLGAFAETVGNATIGGRLNGTGTLTAASYTLTGGTVIANLGAGTLTQASGTSTLNGISAAATVNVTGGTLALGASNRIADTAAVSIASGAALNLGANSDTVGSLALSGALNGTGTLTAATYTLTGGTANANLGAGTLTQASGTSTLNGTSAAATVNVTGGTLVLGAAERISDAAALAIAVGGVLDLGAFAETVGTATIAGSLNGTGTLTAARYTLDGAAVNANLGAGTLVQRSGTSTLTGTSAAAAVNIDAGVLVLGANERIADAATVTLNAGATLNLANRTETIGTLANGANGGGTVATGTTGRLVAGGTNASFAFGGAFTGTGDVDKVGTGTLSLASTTATTARLNALAGTLTLTGATGGAVRVAGGTLNGGATIGGNLSLASGTLSPGTTAAPIGTFQAASLTVTGGNLVFDLAGAAGSYASDLIRVTGAATLNGGTVSTRTLESNANYQVAQFYTVLQAGSLSGTFANGQTLSAVSNDASLQYRLRYDLVPNSVVVELRKQIDFATGLPGGGTGNQQAVAGALNGSAFTASDAYAAALNQIASGTAAQRAASFDSISGEAIGDIATGTLLASTGFADLMRKRINGGGSAAGGGTGGMAMAHPSALQQVRAAAGTDGTVALAGDGQNRGLSAWLAGYGSDGRLDGRNGAADVDQFYAGVGIGFDAHFGALSIGAGIAANQVETRVAQRTSKSDGTLYQGGGYVAYDNGATFANVVGSYFEGDLASRRSVLINGAFFGQARGKADVHGFTAGGAVGHRFMLDQGFRVTPILSVGVSSVKRDAFTETGAGVLSLAVGAEKRELYQGTGELRLSHRTDTGYGWFEPFVSGGVRRSWGDRDATSAMRFSGAPTGVGAFTIQGAELPKLTGILSGGLDARVSDKVTLGISADSTLSDRFKEGRVNLNLKIGF